MSGSIVVFTEPLGRGKKFLAILLFWGIPVLMIFGITLATVVAIINPAAQIEKARQMQQLEEIR